MTFIWKYITQNNFIKILERGGGERSKRESKIMLAPPEKKSYILP